MHFPNGSHLAFSTPSFGPCNLIMAPVPRAQRCYWVCPAPAGGSDLCPSPYQLQLRGTEKQQSSPGGRSGIRQLRRRMLSSGWALWCHCPHAVPWGNLTPALSSLVGESSFPPVWDTGRGSRVGSGWQSCRLCRALEEFNHSKVYFSNYSRWLHLLSL